LQALGGEEHYEATFSVKSSFHFAASCLKKMNTKQQEDTKEIIVSEPKELETATFIQQAIQANLPIETMEKLFALHEKFKEGKAKEAYILALSKFQGECPIIQKTKKVLNKDGRGVRYQYAPLDSIIEQVKELLAKNGLSYRWEVENKPDIIKATAIITHKLGHSESSSFEVPIDKDAYMTLPQTYASALTFAKRYTFCNALGISTGDEDTDATDVGKESDAKSLKAKIVFLLRSLGHEPKTTKEYEAIVKKLTQFPLTEKNFLEIVGRLEILVKEKNEYEKNTSNAK
jgi:hypothetical protein